MRAPQCLVRLVCLTCVVSACFSLGCAATPVPVLPATPLLPEDPASPAPELSMSWKTVQTACDAETRRLVDARRASQSNKRTVEAVLAGAAGAMALGSAVHAALADDGPNAFVIVPLAGGSAAAAAPLTVMLLDADRDDATEERLARIEDQRDRVRDAHDAWLATARESGRRATRKEQVDGGGGGQGRGENRGPRAAFEATDKALAAAAARLAEAETAVRALPSEKDKKPEPARADALARLEAAKRELEAATNASNQARSEVRDVREDRAERMAEKTARADDASLAAAHALDAELARLAAICRGP